MPSRKRNKGKERKAKKAELELERIEIESQREAVRNHWLIRAEVRDVWQEFARGEGEVRQIHWSVECNHGTSLVIPDDVNHPVTSFMDSLFLHVAHNPNNVNVEKYLRDTFTRHQEVWDNKRYREMAVNIFIAIGTNSMLSKKRADSFLAHAIVVLENYDGINKTLNGPVIAAKLRDLLGSSAKHRDELKFYRKRTTCSCLKDMHLEARKTLPKLGICHHCGEEKERRLLMVCGKCKISQYCSKECQSASWPAHKSGCVALLR